jgi:4-carboxymuconolactone decarboxylase
MEERRPPRPTPPKEETDVGDDAEPTASKQTLADFAPKLISLTNDVLFGDVWKRPELSPRDRSLITISALVAGGNSEQLPFHLKLGKENGLTQAEITEAITHLAFYTGWPRAMSAIMAAKQAFSA